MSFLNKSELSKRVFLVLIASLASAGCSISSAGNKSLAEHVQISTVPIDPALTVRSATYTPSGKVLVSYYDSDAKPGSRDLTLAVMDDDGGRFHRFFSTPIPDRDKDNGLRFMVFPDNKRIFLGDFIIECEQVLERCEKPALLPVFYPDKVAKGDHISHRWSEIIVAPDNVHIAWTTLFSDYSAAVFTGSLQKIASGYQIVEPLIVSTMEAFTQDPQHTDGVIPNPVRNGEVKQFVAGGKAISMVGAITRDMPDSVVQHLNSGELEAITDTPGYTETTIFSPDERLGIVMTTRFSEKTDLSVLGLMPRPYPASLNMGLSMFAYTYSVVGVRNAREGNVGPALIDIAASKAGDGYQGINLSTDENWVYHSPMSWHPKGKKAMWLEGLRGQGRHHGSNLRIQIVHLPDYKPAPFVPAEATPDRIPYAYDDMSVLDEFLKRASDTDVKVYGKHSGFIQYRRDQKGNIEKRYFDFSDDGKSIYNGYERTKVKLDGNSNYTAKVSLSGEVQGEMNLTMTFGPLRGDLPAALIFDSDDSGSPQTRGYVVYNGKRITVENLAP